mgnify:CR=1 FL=1
MLRLRLRLSTVRHIGAPNLNARTFGRIAVGSVAGVLRLLVGNLAHTWPGSAKSWQK